MEDIKIEGMEEILIKLKKLPFKIQDRVVIGAIRASAKPIIKEARALVPKKTGTLKKSIGVVKRRTRDKNIIKFSVAPLNKKGGWYGGFIEFGTIKTSPKPFIRPAFERKGHETIDYAREYMRKRIDRELAKL